jgi:DMSO/TMAO reductase YedYZ molybdopterin-dependent catalytic subunit
MPEPLLRPERQRLLRLDRRQLLRGGVAVAGSGLLGGCDRIARDPRTRNVLARAENVSRWLQRLITPHDALAPEFTERDIAPSFRANGTTDPEDEDYQQLAANKFADWRLAVGGLVNTPLTLSLADLRALPSRTQITRHDCVEGWSCIGKWKGARLGPILQSASLQPGARYIVFYCADSMDSASFAAQDKYYESIDLIDAFHPQTILAYDLNDEPLPVRHGAPLRLRVERQLGYKMAKYVMRIEAVDSLDTIEGGMGGYWEDRGYAWYAGI